MKLKLIEKHFTLCSSRFLYLRNSLSLRYASTTFPRLKGQYDSGSGAVGTPEFEAKENAQSAMAQQYARSSGMEVKRKEKMDDKGVRTMEDGTHEITEEKSVEAKKLGLHLPQSGFGPTEENIEHAKTVKEESKKREDTSGVNFGVKERKETKEYES